MKKSQVLAALALAFALGLGVVAPVANTYAVMSSNTTAEQKTEINNASAVVNADAADVENLTDYETIYDDIETYYSSTVKNGIRAKLVDVLNAALKVYNDGPAIAKSPLNALIQQAINQHGLAFRDSNLTNPAVRPDATPVTLSLLSSEDDVYSAIDTLKALIANVTNNKGILGTNYEDKTGAATTSVADLTETYDKIVESASYWVNTLEDNINTNFTTVVPGNSADFGKAFINIDKAAWETLTSSDAWTDAAKNAKTEKAVKWAMIIKAAENLPKYKLVPAVEAAKANYDKIASDDTTVDYSTAKDYIAKYAQALENFKNGTVTTPTNPDNSGSNDNQGAGDADNNTDDKKDDTTVGNTGAIASANGTASSTVAVVAGIATALTAAGAGVVAYRNARREA